MAAAAPHLHANRGSKWSGAAQALSFADDARRANKHAQPRATQISNLQEYNQSGYVECSPVMRSRAEHRYRRSNSDRAGCCEAAFLDLGSVGVDVGRCYSG